MNFAEMQAEVRIILNEATANFWSDADIQDSLNEGYEEISDATEWYERMTNIPLWSGRTYFDLRELLSDELIAPRRAVSVQTDKWLSPSSVRTQDGKYRQWERNFGDPDVMFMRGLWWLGWHPKPSADGGFVRLYFSALPPEMSSDTDEPAMPEEYHLGLVEYAAYDLLAQDAEVKKALYHWQQYMGYESKLREYVQGRITQDKVGQFG
jgi:hypothetical protein